MIALSAAGCDTPRLDAELLLAHVLGVGRAAIIAAPGRELEPDEARAFMDLAARRRAREPVAYILGEKGFRRSMLAVDPRVLVPRPETEFVVEAALSLPASARVVDVGTGSGAIALALKDERPDLEVLGTDISAGALDVARGERGAARPRRRVRRTATCSPASGASTPSSPTRPTSPPATGCRPTSGFEPRERAVRRRATGSTSYGGW